MSWICHRCETENKDGLLYCEVCEEPSPFYSEILREEEAWNNATQNNTEDSYGNYLRVFPDGKHQIEAHHRLSAIISEKEIKAEDELWTKAVSRNTISAYDLYIKSSKKRKYIKEANKKREELLWSVATTDATESSYRDYLQKTELKTHKVEAEKRLEAILWEAAVKKNTLESYREYKLKSPIIRKECEVEIQSIERTQWSIAVEADTTSGYGRYLGYFITGYHSSDARKRISELASINQEEELWCKAKISDSLASYRNYLKESSLRKYAKEALENIAQYDDEAWQKARKADSEAEYKNYIASFPEGIHLQKCNDRIENLGFKEDLKRTFKWVLILIVIIAFIILAIIGLAGNEDSPVPITPIEETRTDSPPPTRISKTEVNVAAIEEELEYKIEALKLLKESKGQLDQTVLRDAKALLDDLRYKSSNYQEYKKQIDNL